MTARERLGTGGPPAPATGGASSSDVPGDARHRRPRLERIVEGLALALLGVLTYAIAGAFQIFERLAAFFTAYEHIQLDELVTAAVVVGGALALRRRSQARREVAEGRRAGQTLSTEVAERQRAERALAANEQRLSTLVANAPVILFALDPAGRFTFCEGRGLAALGLRPGQAVGQSALELYRDVPRVVADVRRALASEAFACAREINGRWFETNYRPVHDSGGAVSGVILVATDVTDRKHFEAALKEARDAALAASRAKSAFLANMSHEIRTPMNAFLGMVDLLADTPLTPEQQEYVDISRRAGDALLGVIDDILDLSKVEAGLLELEATDFDLLELVRETAAVLSGPVRAKGLALTYELAVGVPPRVRGDAQRLRQVLLNLLGNAVKFTERGAVALTVESFPQPSVEWGGSSPLESSTTLGASHGTSLAPPLPSPLPDVPVTLRFAVRDTGIGIAADKLDSIFNAFSQVDASTTRRYGGTGLGLAIVERLVGLMGGRVAVESVYGQGSTFAFSVPLWPVGPLVGAPVN
ncbi:MAG: ATP-binding protein, partial [Chloroflexota bacterium]|nr:ATP-binding protein [Chloroflexota bacterium]